MPLGSYTEPVTLAEAKSYCRVTTNAEDDLIELMISSAREAIEVATGLSLIQKQIVVFFNNINGTFELPFGPVNVNTLQLYDMGQNGLEITSPDYNLFGGVHPKLQFPRFVNLKAIYIAGQDCIAKDLKLAILDQISYDY
jgi:uncharacterized phiE125 gp8 family phage protein